MTFQVDPLSVERQTMATVRVPRVGSDIWPLPATITPGTGVPGPQYVTAAASALVTPAGRGRSTAGFQLAPSTVIVAIGTAPVMSSLMYCAAGAPFIARQSNLAGTIRGSFFVIKGEY